MVKATSLQGLDEKHHLRIYWILMALALASRLAVAMFSNGYWHPDEHFQVLEPARGMLRGFWYETWEWKSGLRSWFLPGLFAGLFQGFSWIGLENPIAITFGMRVVLACLSLLGLQGAYQLLMDRGQAQAALVALGFLALFPFFSFLSVRSSSEVLSTLPLIWSHVYWFRAFSQNQFLRLKDYLPLGLAGFLLGMAFCIRFQSGLFLLPLSIGIFFNPCQERRWKRLFVFVAGFMFWILFQGLLDLYTWKGFLHSPWAYFKFNVLQGHSAFYGVAPWHRYFTALSRLFTLPLAALVGFLLLQMAWQQFKSGQPWDLSFRWLRRSIAWLLISPLFFVLFHMALAHKEDRFLVPILPFLVLLIAWVMVLHIKPMARRVLLLVIVLACAHRFYSIPWKQNTGEIALSRAISEIKEIQGVGHFRYHPPAGFFYLDRRIEFRKMEALSDLHSLPSHINAVLAWSENGVGSAPEVIRELASLTSRSHCRSHAVYLDLIYCP